MSIPRPDTPKPSDKTSNKKFVLPVAWSPNRKRLACGSMDGIVCVFDVDRSKLLHQLEGHNMPVRSLVFSHVDPRILFWGSDDGHVNMHDAEGKTLVSKVYGIVL